MSQITVGVWKGEEGKRQVMEFRKEVIARMSEPPWNSTEAQERNLPVFYNLYYFHFMFSLAGACLSA